jgi:flagellar biosynthesis/type III secretory pathway M-ring protein FliF/YscJ
MPAGTASVVAAPVRVPRSFFLNLVKARSGSSASAKEMTLGQLLSKFPNVSAAQVMIDPTQERIIGSGAGIQPSATVYLSMRDGIKPDKKLVYAAADVVAGAQAGLPRDRVAIIVDGVSYPVRAKEEDGFGGMDDDIIQLTQMHERRYVNKIQEQLAFIKGALVSVTVDLNTVSKQEQATEVDPLKFVHKPIEETTTSEETSSNSQPSGDVGVGANTQVTVESSGGGGEKNTSTIDKTETRYQLETSRKVITSRMPAGTATVVAATVRVPRSFFLNLFKARSGNSASAKEPDDAVLKPIIDAELPKIRDDVMACTGLTDMNAVKVETYPDLAPMLAAPPATASAAPVTFLLGSHVKEIGVFALAVFSLLMVMMMVRKSTPAPVISMHAEPKEPPQLGGASDLAGEVGAGDMTLDGMELDEDAVKTHQMLSQVETMVKENPDGAANLVKRWLNR